jgi:hypothetical protein
MMKRSTYRMVRDAGYSPWHAFRAAFFGIDLPYPLDKTITNAYASFPDPDTIRAEANASRAELWKSGDEKIRLTIVADCVEELDKLVRGNPDPWVEDTYLNKLRRIDPELDDRVSAGYMAKMKYHGLE